MQLQQCTSSLPFEIVQFTSSLQIFSNEFSINILPLVALYSGIPKLRYKCHDVYHSPSFQSLKTHLSVFLTVLKKLWHPSNIKQRERGRERVSKKLLFSLHGNLRQRVKQTWHVLNFCHFL